MYTYNINIWNNFIVGWGQALRVIMSIVFSNIFCRGDSPQRMQISFRTRQPGLYSQTGLYNSPYVRSFNSNQIKTKLVRFLNNKVEGFRVPRGEGLFFLYQGFFFLGLILGILVALHSLVNYLNLKNDMSRVHYNNVVAGFVFSFIFIFVPSILLGLIEARLPIMLNKDLCLPTVSFVSLLLLNISLALIASAVFQDPTQSHWIIEAFFSTTIHTGNPVMDLYILALYVAVISYSSATSHFLLSVFLKIKDVGVTKLPLGVWLVVAFAVFVLTVYVPGIIFVLKSY